jgi:GT2 family glycosyltransferase
VNPASGSDTNRGGQPDTGAVALVVVTYNSAAVLGPLLDSIESSTLDSLAEITVVDNASTDTTVDLVRHRLPSALVSTNGTNLGFAKAVNQGVAATSAGLILLANPDVQWSDGTISKLIRFLTDHPKASAVCPRLVFPDGATQSSIRRFPTHLNIWLSRQSPLRFLRHLMPSRYSYTVNDPKSPERVEAVAAAFMLVRRDAFDAVGGMDEGYFLYVEDTDLCKRWHDRGYEVWVDPTVTVTHDWQGGSGNRQLLRANHRRGIRRYFHVHHAEKSFRNAMLDSLLTIADWWDRFGNTGSEGQHP